MWSFPLVKVEKGKLSSKRLKTALVQIKRIQREEDIPMNSMTKT